MLLQRLILVLLCTVAWPMAARDLPAASDGEHLWLIEQAPAPKDDQDAGPELIIYHLPPEAKDGQAIKLDPITGQLMPRGIAAGDGRLIILTDDRQIKSIRPVWSEMMRRWVYQTRSLTKLPEGCTLLSIVMSDRGPWALVHVQSDELLQQLDEVEREQPGPTDEQILNEALGLPHDLQWDDAADEPAEPNTTQDDAADASATDTDAADDADAPQIDASPPDVSTSATKAPAYRLIQLRSSRWVSSPLPEGFDVPRDVAMIIREDEDRPTLLVDSDRTYAFGSELIRYTPVAPIDRPSEADENTDAPSAQAPAWVKLRTDLPLQRGRLWSATLINGQAIVAIERYRPSTAVTVDNYLLRSNNATELGQVTLPVVDNARWAVLPLQNAIGIIASPVPQQEPTPQGKTPTAQAALLGGLTLAGQPLYQNDAGHALLIPISAKQPTALEGNADLLIQILAFITAMAAMVYYFYIRDPQQPDPIDLPEHLVLASFSRRAISGLIDLAPGFWLASLLYDVTLNDIVFFAWPGNGVEKAFAAMAPGFVVIGVTLFHTTIMEFIFARSVGKFATGLYVAELSGKPAPPLPCLTRALSKAFELFAPLLILVAIISPARQRLGDIFAKTTIVMSKPKPFIPDEDDDQ